MDLGIPSFRVHPLNFEEFLLFQNNSELVEHNFNKYMRFGGFPLLAKLGEGIEKEFPRLFYYVLEEFDIDILKYFATYSGHSRSIFTAYDALKKRRRISKDKLYRNFNLLIDNGYIICITEHQKMRNKRYYLMDHSFQGFFSEKSNIFVRFENMIVAELWKRNITNVAYYKSIPFYFHDEKKAIIPAPFMEIEKLKANIIKLISSLQEIELRRIEAVTIGVDETFRYGNIEIEAISFWKWAILL
jgi:predicted AAA+ superfamily ATPase